MHEPSPVLQVHYSNVERVFRGLERASPPPRDPQPLPISSGLSAGTSNLSIESLPAEDPHREGPHSPTATSGQPPHSVVGLGSASALAHASVTEEAAASALVGSKKRKSETPAGGEKESLQQMLTRSLKN